LLNVILIGASRNQKVKLQTPGNIQAESTQRSVLSVFFTRLWNSSAHLNVQTQDEDDVEEAPQIAVFVDQIITSTIIGNWQQRAEKHKMLCAGHQNLGR
jgi:hypothetical protein